MGAADGDAEASGGCPCLSLCCDRHRIQTWSSQDPEHPFLCISVSALAGDHWKLKWICQNYNEHHSIFIQRGNLVSEFRAQPLLFTQLYLVSSVSSVTVLPLS